MRPSRSSPGAALSAARSSRPWRCGAFWHLRDSDHSATPEDDPGTSPRRWPSPRLPSVRRRLGLRLGWLRVSVRWRAWPAPTLEGAPRARCHVRQPAPMAPDFGHKGNPAQWPGAAILVRREGQPSPRAVGQTLRIGVTITSGVHTADTAGADWRPEHAKSPHEHQRKHHRLTSLLVAPWPSSPSPGEHTYP
jgi:hypothetical protein